MPIFLVADTPNTRHFIHSFSIDDGKKNIAGGGEKSKMIFAPFVISVYRFKNRR